MRIRPKYYLRRWKHLEANRNRLNIDEVNRAKVLFNALNKLSEDDINILKVKYYDGEKLTNFDQNRNIYCCVEPITDQLVADGLGLSIRDYQKLRHQAEANLSYAMGDIDKVITEKSDLVYLKIKGLYIKSVEFVPCAVVTE